MFRMRNARPLGLLVVLFTAACGASPQSLNPMAPSAFGGSTATAFDENGDASSTASVSEELSKPADKGKREDKDKREDKGKPEEKGKPDDEGKSHDKGKLEIEGVISAVTATSITVKGHVVVVPADAVIRHGSRTLTFADLLVGTRVHVKAHMEGTTLEATEVKVQRDDDDEDDDDDDGAAAEGTVRVTVLDSKASETGTNTGAFRLVRTASTALPLTSPLTVTFTLTGTATNGTDYASIPLTATFAAGQASVDVTVTPIADATVETSETVVLTLTTVTPYTLGSPAAGTVTIADEAVPVITVAASDATAAETGSDTGTFRFSRTGSTVAALTVTFTLTGTAVNGTDYTTLPLTVTFLAGQATADVVVTPTADAVAEAAETVIVTITDGAAYDLGTPATATVTIAGQI